jgi:hypothetical protein
MPDGVLYVPCGDRRASVCPPCAETYRADTYQLIRAGIIGGKGIPTSVAGHPAVFATFTAPSFGPVHSRSVSSANGKVRPCRPRRNTTPCPHGRLLTCTQRHKEDSPSLGRPLCLDCYDHAHHVVWNGWAGELWRRTTITIARRLRPLGKAYEVKLRISYGKVAEYQRRGVVHFHALIRLDLVDPDRPDEILAPPAGITAVDLAELVAGSASSTGFTTPDYADTGHSWPIEWGPQLDVRPVNAGSGQITSEAVAAYLAKYATKATEATGHVSRRITTDTIATYASTATHAGRLIRTCWTLGHRPDQEHPAEWKTSYGRLRRWAHMLGFGGHFATKSRRYSTTRRALKTARRQWRRARHYARRAAHNTAEHTEETTLIVGALTFAGVGYRTTGDQWLALTAAAQAREQREIAKRERKCA